MEQGSPRKGAKQQADELSKKAGAFLQSAKQTIKKAAEEGKPKLMEKHCQMKEKGSSLVEGLRAKLQGVNPKAVGGVRNSRSASEEEKIVNLCALGFSVAAVRHALIKCRGSTEQAGVWLIDESNQDEILAAEMQAESDGPLEPGCCARVAGLQGAMQLNGHVVELEQWNDDSQRWVVRLKSGESKSIRPRNLERVQNSAPSSPVNKKTLDSSLRPEELPSSEEETLRARIRKLLGGDVEEEVLAALTLEELRDLLPPGSAQFIEGHGISNATASSCTTSDPSSERIRRLEAAEKRRLEAEKKHTTMDDWRRTRPVTGSSSSTGRQDSNDAQPAQTLQAVAPEAVAPEALHLNVDANEDAGASARIQQEELMQILRAEMEEERRRDRQQWAEEMQRQEAEVLALRARLSEESQQPVEQPQQNHENSSQEVPDVAAADLADVHQHEESARRRLEQLEAAAGAQAERVEAVEAELAQDKERAAADRAELEEAARHLSELDAQRSEWEHAAQEHIAALTEQQLQNIESITAETEEQRARMEMDVRHLEEHEMKIARHFQYLQEEQDAQVAERGRLDNQKRSLARMQLEVLRSIQDSQSKETRSEREVSMDAGEETGSADGSPSHEQGNPDDANEWELDWSKVGGAVKDDRGEVNQEQGRSKAVVTNKADVSMGSRVDSESKEHVGISKGDVSMTSRVDSQPKDINDAAKDDGSGSDKIDVTMDPDSTSQHPRLD